MSRQSIIVRAVQDSECAYDLELNGHDTEVEHLHCWPDDVVRLERWDIYVSELLCNSISSTTFSHRHEGEEGSQTWYTRMLAFCRIVPRPSFPSTYPRVQIAADQRRLS